MYGLEICIEFEFDFLFLDEFVNFQAGRQCLRVFAICVFELISLLIVVPRRHHLSRALGDSRPTVVRD